MVDTIFYSVVIGLCRTPIGIIKMSGLWCLILVPENSTSNTIAVG